MADGTAVNRPRRWENQSRSLRTVNQSIDLSIAKLSSPVEVLDINRRAYRALQRASIYTVAELVLIGRHSLETVKQIGILTAGRILAAAAKYLGLSEEQLKDVAAAPDEAGFNVWKAPVRALPLPASTCQVLEEMGCFRVEELLRARAIGYERSLGLSSREIVEVNEGLKEFLGKAAQAQLRRLVSAESLSNSASLSPVLILRLPRLMESDRSAIENSPGEDSPIILPMEDRDPYLQPVPGERNLFAPGFENPYNS
jgi:hypothetical protein